MLYTAYAMYFYARLENQENNSVLLGFFEISNQ